MEGLDGVDSWNFDALGRWVQKSAGSGPVQGVYDPTGHLLSLMISNGQTMGDTRLPLVAGGIANYVSTGLYAYLASGLAGDVTAGLHAVADGGGGCGVRAVWGAVPAERDDRLGVHGGHARQDVGSVGLCVPGVSSDAGAVANAGPGGAECGGPDPSAELESVCVCNRQSVRKN